MNAAAKKFIFIPIVFFVLSAPTIAQTPKAKPPLLSCDVNVDCKNKDDAVMKMRMSWMQMKDSKDTYIRTYGAQCFEAVKTLQSQDARAISPRDIPGFLRVCNQGLERMQ